MTKQLLHNSIQCPDGTILVSRHQRDFVSHTQKDGREYFTDGGLAYQRIGFSDKEYTDLSVHVGDPHEKTREGFTWGRSYDKDMNPLPKPELVLLRDITDDHLKALVKWTETGYTKYINRVFIDETKWRENNG